MRSEAMRRWKAAKVTPFAELTIGTAIATLRERLRTVAKGCATSGERSSTPTPPEWNGNPCYAFGKNAVRSTSSIISTRPRCKNPTKSGKIGMAAMAPHEGFPEIPQHHPTWASSTTSHHWFKRYWSMLKPWKWGFPYSHGGIQHGLFIMENPIRMDDNYRGTPMTQESSWRSLSPHGFGMVWCLPISGARPNNLRESQNPAIQPQKRRPLGQNPLQWRFPKMGLPLDIIHFRLGFSMIHQYSSTIQRALGGTPNDNRETPISPSFTCRNEVL